MESRRADGHLHACFAAAHPRAGVIGTHCRKPYIGSREAVNDGLPFKKQPAFGRSKRVMIFFRAPRFLRQAGCIAACLSVSPIFIAGRTSSQLSRSIQIVSVYPFTAQKPFSIPTRRQAWHPKIPSPLHSHCVSRRAAHKKARPTWDGLLPHTFPYEIT